MASAQDAYRRMVNEQISPRLRAAGFAGSAGAYRLEHPTHWIDVRFQKSTGNSDQRVTFTVNLLVSGHHAWRAFRAHERDRPEQPSAGADLPAPYGWSERIAAVMPERDDVWWTVEAGQDTAHVADEVVNAIVDLALPRMLDEARNDQAADRLRGVAVPVATVLGRLRTRMRKGG